MALARRSRPRDLHVDRASAARSGRRCCGNRRRPPAPSAPPARVHRPGSRGSRDRSSVPRGAVAVSVAVVPGARTRLRAAGVAPVRRAVRGRDPRSPLRAASDRFSCLRLARWEVQGEGAALVGRAVQSVISPPSRRTSSRLIDRPKPGPAVLAGGRPSAWANASKISCCCSAVMPMPVSSTLNAITRRRRLERLGSSALQPLSPARRRMRHLALAR